MEKFNQDQPIDSNEKQQEEKMSRRNFLKMGAAGATVLLPEIAHSVEDAFGFDFDAVITLIKVGDVKAAEESLLSRLGGAKQELRTVEPGKEIELKQHIGKLLLYLAIICERTQRVKEALAYYEEAEAYDPIIKQSPSIQEKIKKLRHFAA